MSEFDEIGDKFYKPLGVIEKLSEVAFYASAALSIITIFVNKAQNKILHDSAQIAFVIAVIAFALLGIAARLYFQPRAESRRRKYLLSDSLSVALVTERVEGYYNNDATNPYRRLAASTMESAFFTGSLLKEMLWWEVPKVVVYMVVFVSVGFWRDFDLGIAGVLAQVVFSEQITVKLARMVFLKHKAEAVYNDLYDLITLGRAFTRNDVQAKVIAAMSDYESAKANAGVQIPQRLFKSKNPALSAEWDTIRRTIAV